MSDAKAEVKPAEEKKESKEEVKKRKAEEEEEEKPTKKAKKGKKEAKTYQLNVNKALDKKHENKALTEVVKLPPSALQGINEAADKALEGYGIKTIEDMGNWKFFQAAVAIETLVKLEEKKGREEKCAMNINKLLDKEHEKKTLKEILKLPLSGFQGLTKECEKAFAGAFGSSKIGTIAELAKNKFFKMAYALTVLAKYETADFSH